jgi:Zn-dependent protease with chaperone function
MLMQRAKKLPGISPASWEHPADHAALGVLRRTPGLDEVVKMLVGGTTERAIRLLHVSGSVRVTDSQFPRVKHLLDRVVDILDWPTPPAAFVSNSPFFNAGVYGVKEPFMVLNSATLRSLDDEELYCVIAHEVGHVMSGHGLYKTVLWMLMKFSLAALPIAGLLIKPLLLALAEWDRKSELSADRAALLALQSERENYAVLMKMAGGDDLSQMDINEFFRQAWEYENQKTLLDSIFKLLNTVGESHPFPVVRLQELRSWAASGQYKAILEGSYVKRGAETGSTRDDIKRGFDYYRTSMEESDDPLARAAKNVGDSISKAAESLRETLKDRFKDRKE